MIARTKAYNPPGPRDVVVDVDRGSHCSNALVQLVRTHDTAPRRCGEVPMSPVWRDDHLALREVPRLRPSIQVSEMRLLRTLGGTRIGEGYGLSQDISLRHNRGHERAQRRDQEIT